VGAKVKYGVRSPQFIWAPCHMMCTAVLILALTLQLPPPPLIWTRITRALLVSKDRRHLFVTPWVGISTWKKLRGIDFLLHLDVLALLVDLLQQAGHLAQLRVRRPHLHTQEHYKSDMFHIRMRFSRVVRASECQCHGVAKVLGSIPASLDTEESCGKADEPVLNKVHIKNPPV
jgi:hypothetical protein